MHSRTTAEEILDDFGANWPRLLGHRRRHRRDAEGRRARAQGAQSRHPKVVVCEPDNSPILASGFAQRLSATAARRASHPGFRPHLMQGWTPDFIPKLANDAVDGGPDRPDRADRAAPTRCAARASSRRRRASSAGISGGATFAGALEVARRPPHGREDALACCPTRASAISRTPLFEDIAADDDGRGARHRRTRRRATAST